MGSYTNSSLDNASLAEVWNGTAWTVQHTPQPKGSTGSILRGVGCASAKFCAAVGVYSPPSGNLTLAEVWNGTAWSLRSTPSNPDNTLHGVSCRASTICTAVGTTFDAGSIQATLVETGD